MSLGLCGCEPCWILQLRWGRLSLPSATRGGQNQCDRLAGEGPLRPGPVSRCSLGSLGPQLEYGETPAFALDKLSPPLPPGEADTLFRKGLGRGGPGLLSLQFGTLLGWSFGKRLPHPVHTKCQVLVNQTTSQAPRG